MVCDQIDGHRIVRYIVKAHMLQMVFDTKAYVPVPEGLLHNPAFSRWHPQLNVLYSCTESVRQNGEVHSPLASLCDRRG